MNPLDAALLPATLLVASLIVWYGLIPGTLGNLAHALRRFRP